MENKVITTSLGSICFTRFSVCRRLPADYSTSPFDNVENLSVWQFLNIVELLYHNFQQIQEPDLEYREVRNTDGEGNDLYHRGYNYTGKRLMRPFILAHFFKETKSYEDAWARWRHKCESFQTLLKDTSKRIFLVSLRLNSGNQEDTPDRRAYLANNLKFMSEFLADQYRRTPADYRVISIVAASDVSRTIIEAEGPAYRQVVVPAEDEANTVYWKRKPRQEYIDIARQYLDELNQYNLKETTP